MVINNTLFLNKFSEKIAFVRRQSKLYLILQSVGNLVIR